MEEVSKSHGRTILFVSHNMDTIRKFCSTTILLDAGKAINKGNTDKIISEYMSSHLQTISERNWDPGLYAYNKEVRITRSYMSNEFGSIISRFDTTEKIGISFEYEILKNETFFTHGINVYNQENVNIFNSHDVISAFHNQKRDKGRYATTVWIPGNLLPEGIFSISIALLLANPVDVLIHEHDVLSFETYTDFGKLSARGNYVDEFPGLIRPLLQWEVKSIN